MAKKNKEEPQKPELSPRSFKVSLTIFPPIAMVQQTALELAQELSGHLELTDIHLGGEMWLFRKPQPSQGEPRGEIAVSVEEQEVSISHEYPIGQLERFEQLVQKVVEAIEKTIKPRLLLGTAIELEYVTHIGDDARKRLLEGLKLTTTSHEDDDAESKLSVFDRPCHLVGLRLSFPPFIQDLTGVEDKEEEEVETPDAASTPMPATKSDSPAISGDDTQKLEMGADWQAILTISCLPEEPTGVSVEVHGQWPMPRDWAKGIEGISERFNSVQDFLRIKTLKFLKNFRGE